MEPSVYAPASALPRDRADQRKGVWTFLVIAFGLAWLPFAALLVVPDASAALILMPFAPAIACLVVRKWITREGFGDAGLRPTLRRWPLYLLALAWPLAVVPFRAALALLFHVAPTGFIFPWGLAAPTPLDLLIWSLTSLALAPLIFGEEFGWRGYLQVRLLANRPLLAAGATGVIWGVWHYPLILAGGEQMENRFVTLLLFPLATTALSVFLGWLRLQTGGVWAGSVAHAANNSTEDNMTRLAFTGHANGVPGTGTILPSILAEAIILCGIVLADHVMRQRSRKVDSVRASAQQSAA